MKELIIQIFGIIGKPSVLNDIFGEGQSFSLDDLEEQVKEVKKGQKIRVKINSGGGSVIEGFAIYDRLTQLQDEGHKITTEVLGLCGSMATVIALSAKPENRQMHTNSEYFVHNPFFQPDGMGAYEADELADLAENLKSSETRILNHYVSSTTSDINSLKKFMDEKKALTAEEAKSSGFISEVIGEEVKEKAEIKKYRICCLVEKKEADPEPKTEVGKLEKLIKSFGEKLDKAFKSKKQAGTKFGDWITTKAEDEAVQAAMIEAVGQDIYDALITGDQDCPTIEQIDSLAAATGDDADTVKEIAIADGCQFDAEEALVKSLRKQIKELGSEVKSLKGAAEEKEASKEVEALKAELEQMSELIVGLKVKEPGYVDPKGGASKGMHDSIRSNIAKKQASYNR